MPPTPVRVVVDHEGIDQTDRCATEALQAGSQDGSPELFTQQRDAFQALLPDMLTACRKIAERQYPQLIARSMAAMETTTGREIRRLIDLQAINPNIRDEEIALCRREQARLREYMERGRPRLDALRLIWKGST